MTPGDSISQAGGDKDITPTDADSEPTTESQEAISSDDSSDEDWDEIQEGSSSLSGEPNSTFIVLVY